MMNENYVGSSMMDMSQEELLDLYGSHDIEARGGWTAVANSASKTLHTSISTKVCLSAAGVSAVSGLVSYNLNCLG